MVRLKVGESTAVHRYGNDAPLDLAGSRTEPADLLRVDDHALTAVRTGTARLFLPRPLVACAEVECLMATVVIDGTSQPR